MLRTFAAVAFLMLAPAASAAAQPADFYVLMQPTVSVNQLLVQQIRSAMPSSDVTALADEAALSLATGEQLEQQLIQALGVAPDDPARSRVQGVLTHTQAALESLRQAPNHTTLDTARARLEQARSEAQEGLDELEPFVAALPTPPLAQPAELPVAGSLDGPELALVPAFGLLLVAFGLTLRRQARASFL